MDPYIGEIRMFAGNFAPVDWAFCNGQLLPISQNTALFSILGTMYGGNGTTNFALPNLQGMSPIGFGAGPGLTPRDLGEVVGSETVTLLTSQMPYHNHVLQGYNSPGNSSSPSGNIPATSSIRDRIYGATPDTTENPQALGVAGGSQPHNNRPPYQAVSFIICLNGIFPPRG
ncbi:MAG TPA: tail fiber protein [Chloroflexia bacterium]|nr:tail fiber protein [Chloroflexia bacterium]